ncbi:hypothetical protein [Dyadobacter sediminis]|uniref:Uncharacterized protein n=1 Tax=Dyadobacter sediminis TaxID=1493691 RepID=A0A5R9K6T5_9BACT|nr:hypothetical protein [Dyadobacter sediminis]TLU89493.1 hypothetical protein FEM55_22405 [Dyadobacter sediminis]GGC04933.1 hypothetical protein GCM10011325_34770 [Dyadobacter sediminis]
MALTKVLITVKTYPTLSNKYDELVCTAGFLENGNWVRIYPIPFRKLQYDKQYSKYDWIEIDLEKNTSDFRPESYKPKSIDSPFKIIGNIDSEKGTWRLRKEVVLKNVYTNMTELIARAKDPKQCISLAVFKPKEVIDFTIENSARTWDKHKLEALKAKARQLDLFKNSENPFEVVQKLPFKFSYKFTSEDGKERTLMIEDWEIGALYWRMLDKYEGNEQKACEDVRKKYFDDFAKTKDLYLFLGTTREYHNVGLNPFIIIGTFHPMKTAQLSLF